MTNYLMRPILYATMLATLAVAGSGFSAEGDKPSTGQKLEQKVEDAKPAPKKENIAAYIARTASRGKTVEGTLLEVKTRGMQPSDVYSPGSFFTRQYADTDKNRAEVYVKVKLDDGTEQSYTLASSGSDREQVRTVGESLKAGEKVRVVFLKQEPGTVYTIEKVEAKPKVEPKAE